METPTIHQVKILPGLWQKVKVRAAINSETLQALLERVLIKEVEVDDD